jgi:hypothetical protein
VLTGRPGPRRAAAAADDGRCRAAAWVPRLIATFGVTPLPCHAPRAAAVIPHRATAAPPDHCMTGDDSSRPRRPAPPAAGDGPPRSAAENCWNVRRPQGRGDFWANFTPFLGPAPPRPPPAGRAVNVGAAACERRPFLILFHGLEARCSGRPPGAPMGPRGGGGPSLGHDRRSAPHAFAHLRRAPQRSSVGTGVPSRNRGGCRRGCPPGAARIRWRQRRGAGPGAARVGEGISVRPTCRADKNVGKRRA